MCKHKWWCSRQRYGFRLWPRDLVVIVIAVVGTIALHKYAPEFKWFLPFVVGHFFLYCNVFRVHRYIEYCWAVSFVANVLWHASQHPFNPTRAMLIQLPITAVVIATTILRKDYHGIGTEKRNLDACEDE